MKTPFNPFGQENILQFSQVTPHETEWLWPVYIPYGACSMLFGRGGAGKGHIMADITARVTTGKPFPGSNEGRPPANALILSSEDDYETVLHQRFTNAGANLGRILAPRLEGFALTTQYIGSMTQLMLKERIRFVYIDPVAQFFGTSGDINKMNHVREWTGALNHAAKETGAAIVIVHHEKKGKEGDEYDRAVGSIDFMNAMRSALHVDDSERASRLLKHIKSNNGPLGPSLLYSIDEKGLTWGEFIDTNTPNAGGKLTIEAKVFLKTYLSAGPVAAVTLLAAALDQGFSKSTLDRAKVGIAESFAKRVDERIMWFWRLKGDTRDPAHIPSVDKPIGHPVQGPGGADPLRTTDPETPDAPTPAFAGDPYGLGPRGSGDGGDRRGTGVGGKRRVDGRKLTPQAKALLRAMDIEVDD